MLKQFELKIHLDGHYTIEDPKCPSYWRGSGCYDIDIQCWADFPIEVWAVDEDQAKQLAYDYPSYDGLTTCAEIETIQVESVRFIKDLQDRGEDEASVIEPVNFDWDENEYDGPDPDDYYESRREYERR